MSQIDKLNFLPHLLWFFILFGIFYFIVFSYILPLVYQGLQTRALFFNSLLTDAFSFNIFFYFITYWYNTTVFHRLLNNLLSYLRKLKALKTLSSSVTHTLFLKR